MALSRVAGVGGPVGFLLASVGDAVSVTMARTFVSLESHCVQACPVVRVEGFHLHQSYWSLSEWSFLTDRSGSSWRSLEFWPGRPHLSSSACTEERTCANCGWPQGQSVQTEDLRLDCE